MYLIQQPFVTQGKISNYVSTASDQGPVICFELKSRTSLKLTPLILKLMESLILILVVHQLQI
jgi:hypothetical protein